MAAHTQHADTAADAEASGPGLRVLMLCFHFPPSPATGGLRPARLAKHFPPWVQAEVLAPEHFADGWHNAGLLDELRPRLPVHRAPLCAGLYWQAPRDAKGLGALPGKLHGLLMRNLVWVPDREVAWARNATRTARRLLAAGRFDVLYCTSPPHSLQRVARALKRDTGIPLVVDFRDPWTAPPRPGQSPSLRASLERRQEWGVLRDADAVVVTTPGQREQMLRSFPGLPESKLQVISDGFDPDHAVPAPVHEPLTEPAAATPERPRQLVFAGHLERGMHVLVDALEVLSSTDPQLHQQVRVSFLGSMHRRLRRQFRRVTNPELYSVGPPVPAQRLQAELAAADALVYVVPPDGHARVPPNLYDYLLAGRPILAFAPRGDAWDILEASGLATLVENTDAAHATSGLRDFVTALAAGRAPHTLRPGMRERFDYKHLAARMADVLAQAAGKSIPGAAVECLSMGPGPTVTTPIAADRPGRAADVR